MLHAHISEFQARKRAYRLDRHARQKRLEDARKRAGARASIFFARSDSDGSHRNSGLPELRIIKCEEDAMLFRVDA